MTLAGRLHAALLAPSREAGGRLGGLDGLRGLAMLMVIACHLHLVNAAWIGLSSFFVLSGFLITRILLKDKDNAAGAGDYFRRFYIRRTLRVFPIYYLYLLLLTAGVFLVPKLAKLEDSLAPAYLYVYNFYLVGAEHEHTRMLDHLWSLSVEEQFYLLWPVVALLTPRRFMPALALVLIALGPVWRLLLAQNWPPDVTLFGGFRFGDNLPMSIYVVTISQIDAFAFGALLNFVDFKPRAWQLWGLVAAMAVLGVLANGGLQLEGLALGWPLFMPWGGQYVWGYTLIDLFWFLVIASIVRGGTLRRFFSVNALDWVGKRSYSIYIIHFPILALFLPLWERCTAAFGQVPGTLLFCLPYLPLVLAISALSFRYVETPMLKLKDRFATDAPRAPAAPAVRTP